MGGVNTQWGRGDTGRLGIYLELRGVLPEVSCSAGVWLCEVGHVASGRAGFRPGGVGAAELTFTGLFRHGITRRWIDQAKPQRSERRAGEGADGALADDMAKVRQGYIDLSHRTTDVAIFFANTMSRLHA